MSKAENCVKIKDTELPVLPDLKISKYSYLLYGNPYGEEDIYKLMQDYATVATAPLLEQITKLKEQVRILEQAVRYESDLCQQALDSRKEMENEVVRYAERVKRDRDYIFELRDTVEELQEEIAYVQQALPEQWRDSVPSVAVSTLVAELEWARKQAYQDGLRDAAEKIEQQHHWITAPGGAALIYAMLTASQKE